MDVSTDTVSVEIETVTKSSGKAIDELITKLNSLQTSLKNAGKSSKNLPLADQLKKLGVSLNDKDIVNKFRSIDNETTKYKNNLNQVITVQKKMKNGMEDYKVSVREASKQTNGFEKFKNSIVGTITKIGLLWGTMNKVKNSMLDPIKPLLKKYDGIGYYTTPNPVKNELTGKSERQKVLIVDNI